VAFSTTERNVTVAGVEALDAYGRSNDAQSLAYVTPNGHTFASIQRAQTSGDGVEDTTQWMNAGFDTGSGISVVGGNANDRGSAVTDASQATFSYYGIRFYNGKGWLAATWSTAGQQFAPQDAYGSVAAGTQGFIVQAQRNLGNAVISGHVDRYRDRYGNV